MSFREIDSDERNYLVHAAILGFDLSSQVKTGENRGLKLRHNFVVIGYQDAMLKKGIAEFKGELQLNPPEDVGVSRYAVAFWVTTPKNSLSIQATGGFVEAARWKVIPL